MQIPCKFQINRLINNRAVDDPSTRAVDDQGTRAFEDPSIRAVDDPITRAVDDPSTRAVDDRLAVDDLLYIFVKRYTDHFFIALPQIRVSIPRETCPRVKPGLVRRSEGRNPKENHDGEKEMTFSR